MKHLFIVLLLSCFASSYCLAQSAEELGDEAHTETSNRPSKSKNIPSKKPEIAVTFSANSDTCNLKINGVDYGEIARNSSKTVKLPLGSYRLFFESLETGATIKQRSFRLSKDRIMGGTYSFPVTFK